MIYLDTHVVVWLHQKRLDVFSDRVKDLIEREDLQISPAVLLELEYLFEIKKINFTGREIIAYLEGLIGLAVSLEPFINVVQEACRIKWTRDPFDRLITAQASIRKDVLITRDEQIRKYYADAVWI